MKIGSEYGGSSGYDPATDAMSHMTVDNIWNGYRGYVVGLSLGNKFTGEHEELVKGAFEIHTRAIGESFKYNPQESVAYV